MNTTKTLGEWGEDYKKLNKTIAYLNEEYKNNSRG